MSKDVANKLLTILAALGAALLPLLVAQGVLNAIAGQDIGVAIAVLVGGWHGGQYAATTGTAPPVTALTGPPPAPAPPVVPFDPTAVPPVP